eukprot:COSAG06_NODE_381_length_16594_cov_7.199454_7_plen_638_part_00
MWQRLAPCALASLKTSSQARRGHGHLSGRRQTRSQQPQAGSGAEAPSAARGDRVPRVQRPMPRADAPLQEVLVSAESTDSAGGVGLSRPASPSRAPRPEPASTNESGLRADGTAGSASPMSSTSSARRRVLVAGRPRPDPDLQPSAEWGPGDRRLRALFVLVGAALLVAALLVAISDSGSGSGAGECNRTCTYTEGVAFGHSADLVAASWVEAGRYLTAKEACCVACNNQAGCGAATFLPETLDPANCFMYKKPLPETVSLDGAAVCSLPSDGTSAAQGSLDTLLGAMAMLTRFGTVLFAFFLGKALEAVGYGGAGLANSVLAPRQAGVDAAGIKNARQAAASEVPERAGWDAIAVSLAELTNADSEARRQGFSDMDAPSTWTEAREALGLSVRQAVWSCGSKLLLWHWPQPLSYFVVFSLYYCTLDDPFPGKLVVWREALYVLTTLLALWVNPAYLLLELDPVLQPAFERCCWCCCRRRVDWDAAWRLALYLLAPHHYVTFCLMRWARGAGRGCVAKLLGLVGIFQFVADFASAYSLCYLLTQEVVQGTALAIGYWLTTAGLVAACGELALVLGGMARRGEDEDGEAVHCCLRPFVAVCRCCCRVLFAVAILVFGCGALFCAGLLVWAAPKIVANS